MVYLSALPLVFIRLYKTKSTVGPNRGKKRVDAQPKKIEKYLKGRKLEKGLTK